MLCVGGVVVGASVGNVVVVVSVASPDGGILV